MKLSIIVPVYNTETQKIYRCFESICNIRNVEFECLIIDDGSNREIGNFCSNYANKVDNFKYIHKKNGGASSARNKGIELANGDKIIFIDADDELFINNLDVCINLDYDIVFTDISVSNNSTHPCLWKAFDGSSRSINLEEVINRISTTGIINGPVGKVIKKDFLISNEIFFDESMIVGEDAIFLMTILENNPSMYYFSDSTYYYHKEDITSRCRMKNIDIYISNNVSMYKKMLELINQYSHIVSNPNSLVTLATERYIKQLFNTAAELLLINVFDEYAQSLLLVSFSDIEKSILDNCGIKTKIEYNVVTKRKWKVLLLIAKIRDAYLILKNKRGKV